MASCCAWHSYETLGPCPCADSRGGKCFLMNLIISATSVGAILFLFDIVHCFFILIQSKFG